MKKLFCDRCGKEIKDVKRGMIHHKVHYGSVLFDSISIQNDVFATHHEICIDCENSFVRWYNHPEKDGGDDD